MEYFTCSVFSSYFLLALLCAMVGRGAFTDQGSQGYVVRYLSSTGVDNSSCLLHQAFALNATACRSLPYALAGGNTEEATVVNLSVMVFPGVYGLGEFGIELESSENVTIKKVQGEIEEVVFRCDRFLDDAYNNLYIFRSRNIELSGITFALCGRFSPSVRFQYSEKIWINNCTFR